MTRLAQPDRRLRSLLLPPWLRLRAGAAVLHLGGALALVALLVSALPAPGHAAHPSVVLEDAQADLRVELDSRDLAGLPLTEFRTGSVWTDAVHLYTGVLLRDLLLHLGVDPSATDGSVTISALDGYSARMKFHEITEVAPMLAFLRDGAPMPLREQGPFWLLFPYDDDPVFQTESIYARSVWQVSHILVER